MFSTSIPETSMISKGICTLTIDCLESSKLKSYPGLQSVENLQGP